MTIKRWVILAVIIATVFYSCTHVTPLPGYCVAEGRFLTDKDYVLKMFGNKTDWGFADMSGTDHSAAAFYERYPKCCFVKRGIANRFFGYSLFYSDTVELNLVWPATVEESCHYGSCDKRYMNSYTHEIDGCGNNMLNTTGEMYKAALSQIKLFAQH